MCHKKSAPGERIETPTETEQASGTDHPDAGDNHAVPPRTPTQNEARFILRDAEIARFVAARQHRFDGMFDLGHRDLVNEIAAWRDGAEILIHEARHQPDIDVSVFELERYVAVEMQDHDVK